MRKTRGKNKGQAKSYLGRLGVKCPGKADQAPLPGCGGVIQREGVESGKDRGSYFWLVGRKEVAE